MHHSVKFAVKCHHSKGGMSASACNLDSSIYILDLRGKKGFVEIIYFSQNKVSQKSFWCQY